jgi:XTP/dITP diphosphohydrolase
MELIFATTNKHKAEEVQAILKGTGIVLRTLSEFPDIPEPPETGKTFIGNALQKARFVWEHTNRPCIADDSGIEVDALDGEPGVFSKRYSPQGTAASNNSLLLARLGSSLERSARFRCVLAFVNGSEEHTVEGRCEGTIGLTPVGEDGFGYDPIFFPREQPGKSMAQLSIDEKNAISHRGRAFRQLPALLPKS